VTRIAEKLLPHAFRHTLLLRYFGLTRIPLLFYTRPAVVECTPRRVVIRIPLNRRTRNHVGSMYFAALAVGADCAAGLLAVQLIARKDDNISFIFKDFNAEFHRRATADVCFSCDQGEAIAELVEKVSTSSQRLELPLTATATVPAESDEPVASFRLTLSLKRTDP
jgi:acyl-coenzyme A thioesterase PaaI-like protein